MRVVEMLLVTADGPRTLFIEESCSIRKLKLDIIEKYINNVPADIKITVDGIEVTDKTVADHYIDETDYWVIEAIIKSVVVAVECDGEPIDVRICYVWQRKTMFDDVRRDIMHHYNLVLEESLSWIGEGLTYDKNPFRITDWRFKRQVDCEYELVKNKYGVPHTDQNFVFARDVDSLRSTLSSQFGKDVEYTIDKREVVLKEDRHAFVQFVTFVDKQYIIIREAAGQRTYILEPEEGCKYMTKDGRIVLEPMLGEEYTRLIIKEIEVTCVRLCGTSETYRVPGCCEPAALKVSIFERTGVPPDQIRLIFNGAVVEGSSPLSSFGIRDKSVINMALRYGCDIKPVMRDMCTVTRNLQKKGLHVLNTCLGSLLRLQLKYTNHNLGYGSFSISDIQNTSCNCCKGKHAGLGSVNRCWWKARYQDKTSTDRVIGWTKTNDSSNHLNFLSFVGECESHKYLCVRCIDSEFRDPNNIKDELCVICCNQIYETLPFESDCGHKFHYGCIEDWKTIRNDDCPLCSIPICDKGKNKK